MRQLAPQTNRKSKTPPNKIDADPAPDIMIVLSLPKCGGTSLSSTLRATFPSAWVTHVHVQSQEGIAYMESIAVQSPSPEQAKALYHHTGIASDIRRRIKAGHVKDPVRYFLGVRDPIAFAISYFFERYYTYLTPEQKLSTGEIAALIESGDLFQFPIQKLDLWFEKEVRETTGIDVFGVPFPGEAGYVIIEEDKKSVCLYQLESFGRLNTAIADFMGIKIDDVINQKENQAEDKAYKGRYQQVIETIEFSPEFISEVYSSKYATHFYNEAELATFKARWIRS